MALGQWYDSPSSGVVTQKEMGKFENWPRQSTAKSIILGMYNGIFLRAW